MKKISFFTCIALLLTLASCNKELTIVPPSLGTSETFYKTQEDFIQSINAVYNDLRPYPDRLINLSETRSDNLYAASVLGTQLYDGINSFRNTIVGNTYIENAWSENFNGIFRANTVLEQLEKNGTVIASAALRTRLQAEARYLRAFFYFDLVRYFGKVPVTTKTVTALQATSIPRSPVAEVYAQIMDDLDFARQNLPLSYTGANVGRATKHAATSLLAMVHMARSGPTYNIEGPGLGLNEWSQALTLINEVIASNQYVFNPNYANIFSYANQSPADNKEAVFDVMYQSLTNNSTLGASFVSLTVPDAYFTTVLTKPAQLGGAGRPTSYDLYNTYEAADVRPAFNFIIYYTQLGIPGNRPYLKKYLDPTKVPVGITDWGINFIAIRYTDMLLLKAECILKGAAGGTQTEVDNIVNQIRKRAGLQNVSNVTLPQLYAERRRELVGEGSRWFDLQRQGNLVETMNAWIATDDVLKQILPVTTNFILYPVPQSQMDAQPGLYAQNPGY